MLLIEYRHNDSPAVSFATAAEGAHRFWELVRYAASRQPCDRFEVCCWGGCWLDLRRGRNLARLEGGRGLAIEPAGVLPWGGDVDERIVVVGS